jgi:hypothetical protein
MPGYRQKFDKHITPGHTSIMAGVNFIFDPTNLKKYGAQLKKMERRVKVATAFMLNEQAFQARTTAIRDIFPTKMIIRSAAFVRNSLRTTRASTRQAIGAQQSEFGSVSLGQSTGWAEQEFGRASRRTHVGTVKSRVSKSRKRVMGSKARMRRGKTFVGVNTKGITGAKSSAHKEHIFIEMLKKERYKEPFVLDGDGKWTPGLYIMRGGGKNKKPSMLQSFEPSKAVKRIRWMTLSIKRMQKNFDADMEWSRIWRRVLYK